jgi:hypothetical protein
MIRYIPKQVAGKIYYAECDICGHLHPENWDGDCRDDTERYTWEELEAKHGPYGEKWELQCFAELIEVPDDEMEMAA